MARLFLKGVLKRLPRSAGRAVVLQVGSTFLVFFLCIFPLHLFALDEESEVPVVRKVPIERISNDAHRDWKVAWSHDGRYLTYEALRYDKAVVRLIDYGDEDPQPANINDYLHKDTSAAEYSDTFSWHPDEFSFTGSVTRRGDYDLLLFQMAGGLRKLLFGPDHIKSTVLNDASGWQGDARFFPSGKKICFVDGSKGNGNIMLKGVPRGSAAALTTNPSMDYAPEVSPDGAVVLFTSRRDGGDNLYFHELDSGESFLVTGKENSCSYGVFVDEKTIVAYRGTSIVEISFHSEDFGTQGFAGDGYGVKTLARNVFLEQRPAVQAGGSLLAYIAQEDEEKPLMLFNRDNGELLRIDTGILYQERPVWTPDGKSIVIEGFDGFQWDLYLLDVSLPEALDGE